MRGARPHRAGALVGETGPQDPGALRDPGRDRPRDDGRRLSRPRSRPGPDGRPEDGEPAPRRARRASARRSSSASSTRRASPPGLNHPGIVVVHDVGRDSGSDSLYIALEYLEGETLSERVQRDGPDRVARGPAARGPRGRRPPPRPRSATSSTATSSPPTSWSSRAAQPKLMDFGIAKVPAAQLTSAGEFFGTPSYMSPEQANGEPLDARSDVFSLGAVLYLLLTGVRAFDAPSVPGHPRPRGQARIRLRPRSVVPGLPARRRRHRGARPGQGRRRSATPTRAHARRGHRGRARRSRRPRHRAGWTPLPPADETRARLRALPRAGTTPESRPRPPAADEADRRSP